VALHVLDILFLAFHTTLSAYMNGDFMRRFKIIAQSWVQGFVPFYHLEGKVEE
jgi:hypothetical protein